MDYNEMIYAAEVRKLAVLRMQAAADPGEDGYEERMDKLSLNDFVKDAHEELGRVARLIAALNSQRA